MLYNFPVAKRGSSGRKGGAARPPEAALSATLAKGLDVLDALERAGRPLALGDLCARLELSKPTAHRLLATLAAYGFVRRDGRNGYRLGMRLFEMSQQAGQDLDLRGHAGPAMEELHRQSGETVTLAIYADGAAVCIDEFASTHHMREQNRIGQRIPLFHTAVGKALVAGLPYPERQELLGRVGERELANQRFDSLAKLSANLDLVGARGYAMELEDHIPGIIGVAAPIVDHRGLAIAAIGLTGPTSRLDRDRLHELGPVLIETARAASLQAGGAPRPVCRAPKPRRRPAKGLAVVAATESLIGECPLPDPAGGRLFWVDICRPAIHRCELATGALTTFMPGEMVSALALTGEGLLVAARSGLRLVDPATGDPIRTLAHPEASRPANRYNDGRLDSQGRFWVGALSILGEENAGGLHRLDPDGSCRRMEKGLTLPNAMDWAPDESLMYLVETSRRLVYAYAFDRASGAIADRRTLIECPADRPGEPVGLAVDREGCIWLSYWDGWRLERYAPDGGLMETRWMSVPRPTGIAFGAGPEPVLYCASARIRIPREVLRQAPDSGAMFALPA